MERYRGWLALRRVAGVGNVVYKRLLDRFESPEGVFTAGEEALATVDGISPAIAKEIAAFGGFDQIDRELQALAQAGISLLTLHDPAYPPLLAAIHDPPPFLYIKGSLQEADPYPIAVVGTRHPTHYGKTVCELLCREMAEQGMTVVSGFARGIDGVAHKAALAAKGRTIAVIGSGIDQIYPPEHARLFKEIAGQGAVLSEFPIGTPPDGRNFPQRNRIISGLSLGCLVVEATLDSGSLITARSALEQGREVFAVPGPIVSPMSRGTHRLIRSGAKLVEGLDDILEEILPQRRRRRAGPAAPPPPLEENEKRLYDLLSYEPKHIDQLTVESAFTVSFVLGLLLSLELKGLVRRLTGQFYVRI